MKYDTRSLNLYVAYCNNETRYSVFLVTTVSEILFITTRVTKNKKLKCNL